MMSFKRAMAFAAFFLTAFLLLRHSHGSTSDDEQIVAVNKQRPSDGSGTESKSSAAWLERKPPSPIQHSSNQKPLQDTSKMTLYEKLTYQYPYDVQTKFPAYIWQTWKWTPESAEFHFRHQEASWTKLHKGFVHEVITDQVAVHLLKVLYAAVPEVLEAYNAMPEPVLKADFFRYLILLARGGIYSDIDTYALKSAVNWIPESVPKDSVGLVIGIEADPDRPDWHDWYSRRIQFCQWTIQSKPGHPVLRDIIVRITEEALKRKAEGVWITKEKSVVEFTGPAIWTDTIFDYFNDPRYFDMEHSKGNITWESFTGMQDPKRVGDVIVLPITSFSPGVGQMGAKDIDDPMAFVRHVFEGTWKPQSERQIGG
ncbi:glycosyltransferase sugar-binding region DXD domain-containing protein-containing protein [Xylariales sp. PMI_506]|nr:glycosyltransferase sugar-binding region DXD domain-containing protein-containing protein [Xylariales sp. PMI_506]